MYNVLTVFHTGWSKIITKKWINKSSANRFFQMATQCFQIFKNSPSKIKVSLYDHFYYEKLLFLKYLQFYEFLPWKHWRVFKLSVGREEDVGELSKFQIAEWICLFQNLLIFFLWKRSQNNRQLHKISVFLLIRVSSI